MHPRTRLVYFYFLRVNFLVKTSTSGRSNQVRLPWQRYTCQSKYGCFWMLSFSSISLDVVSLYTSIPIQEAITNATDRIHNPIFHLAKQDIKDLLTVTLNNMYFSFNDQVFRQKEGLPMGSNISAILAILFMDRLETIALSSHLSIRPYKRYVDDIYLQTTCEDMADQFHSTMNNLHPKLTFEIEKPEITPSSHSLSLLYFKVTISKDGKSSFEFYKKTAKKPIFVHHQSAIPKKS